jgi:hypothetical protein
MSTREIATQVEVSAMTVRRDLDGSTGTGVPVDPLPEKIIGRDGKVRSTKPRDYPAIYQRRKAKEEDQQRAYQLMAAANVVDIIEESEPTGSLLPTHESQVRDLGPLRNEPIPSGQGRSRRTSHLWHYSSRSKRFDPPSTTRGRSRRRSESVSRRC